MDITDTAADDVLAFEFLASMQPHIDRMRRVVIRCGAQRYVGLLNICNEFL
uniref:Sm domain-containing protein n=1 Tax=Macrostomum lignano TaxID=282301 RepID=A0A1I8FYD6_9PLAT